MTSARLSIVVSAVLLSGCTLLTSLGGLTGDTPTEDAGTDAPKDPGTLTLTCDTTSGEKVCFGACTSVRDPQVGCSAADCIACDPRHVDQPTCAGTASGFGCSYGSCAPRYQDCDDNRANGCELSKNNKSACGDCTAKCEGPTPFCAPSGASFACAASCPAGTQACDGACVDVSSDAENCGACGKRCERAGATGLCASGVCTYQCRAGLKDCNGTCVSVQDPQFCVGCSPCPAPGPNAAVSCSAGACAVSCLPGTYDCDGVKTTGCESTAPCGPIAETDCAKLVCTDTCCPGIGCCSSQTPPSF